MATKAEMLEQLDKARAEIANAPEGTFHGLVIGAGSVTKDEKGELVQPAGSMIGRSDVLHVVLRYLQARCPLIVFDDEDTEDGVAGPPLVASETS